MHVLVGACRKQNIARPHVTDSDQRHYGPPYTRRTCTRALQLTGAHTETPKCIPYIGRAFIVRLHVNTKFGETLCAHASHTCMRVIILAETEKGTNIADCHVRLKLPTLQQRVVYMFCVYTHFAWTGQWPHIAKYTRLWGSCV